MRFLETREYHKSHQCQWFSLQFGEHNSDHSAQAGKVGSGPRPNSCRKVQERAHVSGTVSRAPSASWLPMGWPQASGWLVSLQFGGFIPRGCSYTTYVPSPLPSPRLEDNPESGRGSKAGRQRPCQLRPLLPSVCCGLGPGVGVLAHEPVAGQTHANSTIRELARLLSISSAH